MVPSVLRNESGEWETVKSRKGDRKKKDVAAAVGTTKVFGAEPRLFEHDDAAKKAFAAFDALYVDDAGEGGGKQRLERPPLSLSSLPGTTDEVKTPDTPPRSDEGIKNRDGGVGRKKDKRRKAAALPPPPKMSNKIAASTTPSSGLNLYSLKSILRDVEMRYQENEVAQLQYIADKMLGAFKDRAMPFPAEVYAKPLEKTVNMFHSVVSPKVATELARFLRSKSTAALQESFLAFVRVLFDGIIGAKGSSTNQVGLVLLITAIARTCPLVVVRCGEDIMKEGPRFTALEKLPLLMWIFAQAEEGGTGATLALWLRIILPQLIGIDLTQQKDKKLEGNYAQTAPETYSLDPSSCILVAECMERAFGSSSMSSLSPKVKQAAKEGLNMPGKDSEVFEPIISLKSLNSVQCAINLESATRIPAQVLSGLETLYPAFRSIAYSTASPNDLQDFVKISLEFAARSEGGFMGPGDHVVAEATENIMDCIHADPECFEIWATKHKGQISGSCRVLQHLLHTSPASFRRLMVIPTNHKAFVKMCKNLQDRHRLLLAQEKGWYGIAARSAHEACKRFLESPKGIGKKQNRWSISMNTIIVTFVTVGIITALVAAKWDDIKIVADDFLKSDNGEFLLQKIESVQVSIHEWTSSTVAQWIRKEVGNVEGFVSKHVNQVRETVNNVKDVKSS